MLASMAFEDAPPMIQQLDEFAAGRQASEYARTAHALKGLLSTFDTGEPVNELQPIIDAARSGDTGAVGEMQNALKPKLECFLAEIREIA